MTISNGSDCPVEVSDVLKGIQLAVTRTSIDGTGPYLKEQALTREEAIESFTIGGAYVSIWRRGQRNFGGRKYDFVVLSDNILDVAVQHIEDIKVLATYVGGGQLVYGESVNESKWTGSKNILKSVGNVKLVAATKICWNWRD